MSNSILDKDDKYLTELDFLDINEELEDYDDDKEPSLSSGESSWDPNINSMKLKDPESIVQGKKLYCARTYEDFCNFVEYYKNVHKMSYDIETNAQSPLSYKADIIGFSIAFSPNEGIYVLRESLDYSMSDNDWINITEELKKLFNTTDSVVVHNCKYEVPYTVNKLDYYLDDNKLEDTMIKCRICYPGEPAGLKPASARYLGYSDWDSVLGLYSKSAKNIINYINWVYKTKKKKNYTDTDIIIYNLIFDDNQRIRDPQLLYEKLYSISNEYHGTASSLIVDMSAIFQVLVQSDSMTEDVLDNIVKKFIEIGKVGLDTNVIPYSLIPSNVISKYGAMDSISTYELDDYMNVAMDNKSKEINDRVYKITNEDLHFDLKVGYHNVKKQFFAGINLEMAGAKWNDDVANYEYDWYNTTAIQSWKNMVNNPKMKDEFLYSNRYMFSSKLKDILLEIYNDTPSVSTEDIDIKSKVLSWLESKGQYKIQKSQVVFYDIVDNVWSKKLNSYTAGPLKVRLLKLFEKFEDELYPIFKNYIDNHIMKEINKTITNYKELKAYYNPASTDPEHYRIVDSILNTNDLKLSFVYDWALLTRSSDRYWEVSVGKDSQGNDIVKPVEGLESTAMLFKFLDMVLDSEDLKIPQVAIFNKFKELLDRVDINNDPKLYEQIKIASEYKIESLKEPQMITLYNMFKHQGIDVEDKDTWSIEFAWLFDFRMYKKCVKMITSYIEGRVGRSSVTIVDKDKISRLLPRRNRWYYDNLEHPFDPNTEDTIMTMPWHVCTADTGRWKSGMHTIPTGSSIKNIYTSRYKGGVIMAPDYCLAPDTRIKLLDGTSPTIKELSDKYGTSEEFEVYSYDHESNEIRPSVARNVRVTKTVDKLYRITLDNDKVIECTDNHPFLTRDGEYVRADHLYEGLSLMPMYWRIESNHKILNGYEVIKHPNGNEEFTHHLVAGIYYGHRDANNKSQLYRHHKNHNRLDNRKDNLEILSASEHMSTHMKEWHSNPEHEKVVSEWMKEAWKDPEYRRKHSEVMKQLRTDEDFERRLLKSIKETNKRLGKDLHYQEYKRYQKYSKYLRLTYDYCDGIINEENYNKTMEHYGYKRGRPKFSTLLSKYSIEKMYNMALTYNHKVKKIEVVDKVTEVYDMEVDKYHNFLIDLGDNSGVFVHNSQMEVRAIAATAHEDSMLEAFRNNADIHRMNACFRGDTKLLVIDPSNHLRTVVKTIKELAEDKYFANNEFEVWSYDYRANDKLVIGKAHHPRKTETGARRVKVTLANDDIYYCTYDHKWLNGNNYWMEISELKGYYVRLSDGSEVKVKDVEYLDEYFDVYDITVDYYENFVVVNNNTKTVKGIDVSRHKSHMLKVGPVVHNSQVWRKPPEEVTAAERRFSKMVTFAILYGANAQNIANNFMGGDLKQAEDMLDKFYTAFPKLKTWIDSMHHLWKETGIVTTLTNRIIKIPIPEKSDPKYRYKYSQKLRQAQNFPIQGSASDIAGVALFSVSEDINSNKLLSKCFSFVHDALYIDVHPYELFRIILDVHHSMNEYPRKTYDMPVKADIVLGYSMGEELDLDIDKLNVVTDNDDYMEGSLELVGFKDEFDKLIDNWKQVYDSVTWDVLESGEQYINRGELFVPKKAISKWYGLTRETITARIYIKSKKYEHPKLELN